MILHKLFLRDPAGVLFSLGFADDGKYGMIAADETEQGGKHREKAFICIIGFGDGTFVRVFQYRFCGGMGMPKLWKNKHNEFLHVLRGEA